MPAHAPRPDRRTPALGAVAALTAALAGCGSAAVGELPPAAGPQRAEVPGAAPTGLVVRVGVPSRRLTPGRTRAPGGAPEGLAYDESSGRLAVGLRDPAQLALVDGATGRVEQRVRLPAAPRRLSVEDGRFLVPAQDADRLLGVRAADGRVLQDVPVGAGPRDVASASNGDTLVADERAASLSVVGGGRRLRSVPVAAQPVGVTPVSGGRVAVLSGRGRAVELFDDTTFAVRGSAAAGVGPTHATSRDNWLWVTDTQGDALLVFRTRPKLELVRRVYLAGGPYDVALDTRSRRLWITLTRTNEVVVLPAHGRPHVLLRLPTVRQPDSVAVDSSSHRVFVAGRDDGLLELIDPPPLP